MEKDFGRHKLDLDTNGTGNPWESMHHEQPDVDAPVQYRRPFMSIPIVRILALILAVLFALYLLYAIFVHPVNKLNFRLLLQQNCTMTLHISLRHGHGHVSGQTEMLLDGNLIAIAESYYTDPYSYVYIEMNGDEIMVHDFVLGDWDHMDYEEYLLRNGESAASDGYFQKLFDRRNYERVRGKLFTWKIKDDVDMGYMRDVQFRRKAGKFTFSWKDAVESEYMIVFESFGRAKIERIWEE
jgi:hypothetical protein